MLGDQHYVLEWDDDADVATATGAVPGPAGSIELPLRGISVELDAADLRIVNAVTVDDARELSRDARRHALLQRLIGERSAAELIATIGATRRRRAQPEMDRPVPMRGVRSEVAQLALLATGLHSPGLTSEERALAQLEAATLIRDLKLTRDVADELVDLEAAATVVANLSIDLVDLLDEQAREKAADVIEQAPIEHASLRSALLRVVPSLRRSDFLAMDQMVAAAPSVAFSRAPALQMVLDLPIVRTTATSDSLPLLLWDLEPSVRRTTGDELEVRLGGCGERTIGWWVRAFRSGTNVPLAVVPLLDDRGDSVATFLLAYEDASEVEIDIVDDARLPRSSPRVAAFRAAVAHGQRAARLERLGRSYEANHDWLRAGDFHAQAGDDSRARQAHAIADQQSISSVPRAGSRVAPVITDLVGPRSAGRR